MVSRNRLSGGGCKPVYAAFSGSRFVVNDTFKRQYYLSGADIRDDRKGTVEEASKACQRMSKLRSSAGLQDKCRDYLIIDCTESGAQTA